MSVINRAKLTAVLQMSVQHQAQLVQMIETMLNAAADNISLMRHYVQQPQPVELQQLLHKIRGSYATLGGEQLAQACRSIEHALENHTAVSEQQLQALISIYQQTCDQIQQELAAYQRSTPDSTPTVDLQQLYTLLVQQDMQACQLAQAAAQQLATLLTPAGAARFSQHIAALEFATAAQLLKPHLSSADDADQ